MPRLPKQTEIVEAVVENQKNLNELTQDRINELAPAPEEKEPELTARERAELENALYLEPRRKHKAIGVLPPQLKKQHDYDWEYVKGMFENYVVNGEPLRFWHCIYPGDPDCLWEIPANRAVYIPRMIAKHLEEQMKYHKFDYLPKVEKRQRMDDFIEEFRPIETCYRGKFRPIGAFA